MKLIRSVIVAAALLLAPALPAFADAVVAPPITAPAAPTVTSVVTTPGGVGGTTTISTEAPTVKIPWGDWLDAAINQIVVPLLGVAVMALLTWAGAMVAPLLPPALRGFVNAKNTQALEQLIVPSLATGLKSVGSDVSGKAIDVPTKNAAVASAANYAVQHGSDALIKWAGGPEGIRQKIQARFDMLDTGVTAGGTTTVAPASVAIVSPPPAAV